MSDQRSMGDLFNERRAARKAQQVHNTVPDVSAPVQGNAPENPPSFLEIQREQEMEAQRRKKKEPQRVHHQQFGGKHRSQFEHEHDPYRSDRRSSSSFEYERDSGKQHRYRPQERNLPREQGCISSLLDKYGFIECADRNEEIFFHFSELKNKRYQAEMRVGDEVEFGVGVSSSSSNLPNKTQKLAAYNVELLSPGTVIWEIPDEPVGRRRQGRVERTARAGGGGGSNLVSQGTIRLLDDTETSNADAKTENNNENDISEEGNILPSSQGGSLIRFTVEDYSLKKSQPSRLMRGDFVEFSMVTERRTGKKFAKDIILVQSEKDRTREAREKKLLSEATLERGIVVMLKDDYGFLRSTSRREEIYFHISNVEMPKGDKPAQSDETGDTSWNVRRALTEGSEMEFLVVDEMDSGSGGKLSARRLKFLPSGTVQFYRTIAKGVVGVISVMPIPSFNSGVSGSRKLKSSYQTDVSGSKIGKVRLKIPITTDGEGGKDISEVLFYAEDSPGGTFALNRDGSQVGLWAKEGDSLLFDVVEDVVDGSYRLTGTSCLSPSIGNYDMGNNVPYSDEQAATDGHGEKIRRLVRLISVSPAGRTEGVVSAIKDGFGFINCAERNADAYFRLYEVLPEVIQNDLLRNMTIEKDFGPPDNKITVGTEVSFDLSLSPTVSRINSNYQRGKSQPEKENLKAQRICILPRRSIFVEKILAVNVTATVSQQHNDGSGFVQLEEPVKGMQPEERHPLVAKMLDSFLSDHSADVIEFPDLLSPVDTQVYISMAEVRGLEATFVQSNNGSIDLGPNSDPEAPPRGSLRISKFCPTVTEDSSQLIPVTPSKDDSNVSVGKSPDENADRTNQSASETSKTEEVHLNDNASGDTASLSSSVHKSAKKKKAKKIKPVRVVRYERACVIPDGGPLPALGDVVTCDVTQSRRTGAYAAINVRIVERKHTETGLSLNHQSSGLSEAMTYDNLSPIDNGTGIVTEIVPARQFGFISFCDETAKKREMLFFHLSSVVTKDEEHNKEDVILSNRSRKKGKLKQSDPGAIIHKGDEVRFDIGQNEKNGKRVALNITVLSRGTLNLHTRVDKSTCEGIILMEPSHTTLSNTPSHTSHSGRWDSYARENSNKPGSNIKEEGYILLVSDPVSSFGTKVNDKGTKKVKDTVETQTSEVSDISKEDKDSPHSSTITDDSDTSASAKVDNDQEDSSTKSAVGTHVTYRNEAIAGRGAGMCSLAGNSYAPRRGDLVSFSKCKRSNNIKDVKVVKKAVADIVKGYIENIDVEKDTATFKSEGNDAPGDGYDLMLSEVVSCDVKSLKNKESVEAILYNGRLYGVCRATDLYLSTKIGRGRKERPRLNLTVRKELKGLGGRIIAQSGMAKGPDGTNGFHQGWTKRDSPYAVKNSSGDSGDNTEKMHDNT